MEETKMELQKKLDDRHYTYKDFKNWTDKERWELIDGVAYAMSPSPSLQHQKIVGAIYREIANYLMGKTCDVFISPLDVFLPQGVKDENESDTIVQPDLMVVCDKNKQSDKGIKGAPDLVVEVVSPASGGRDKVEKLNLYERSGVKEYWILDPDDSTLMVFKLDSNGTYGRPDTYNCENTVRVGIFESLEIDLKKVF
jgi:Uma2 family endonuclease